RHADPARAPPSPSRTRAPSARARSRTGASYQPVLDSARPPRSPPRAREPCRTSGRRRAPLAVSRDASDRCKWRPEPPLFPASARHAGNTTDRGALTRDREGAPGFFARRELLFVYSTVTDLARFLGLSTSLPRSSA